MSKKYKKIPLLQHNVSSSVLTIMCFICSFRNKIASSVGNMDLSTEDNGDDAKDGNVLHVPCVQRDLDALENKLICKGVAHGEAERFPLYATTPGRRGGLRRANVLEDESPPRTTPAPVQSPGTACGTRLPCQSPQAACTRSRSPCKSPQAIRTRSTSPPNPVQSPDAACVTRSPCQSPPMRPIRVSELPIRPAGGWMAGEQGIGREDDERLSLNASPIIESAKGKSNIQIYI